MRSGWPSTARVCAGPRRCARQALAQRGEVGAGVDVEQQRGGPLDAGRRRPRRARARGGARSCPGRSSGRSRRAELSSRPLVPVPWRSGTITTSRAAFARGERSSASSSAGSSAGQSPGTQSTRSMPSASARRRRARRRRDWPSSAASSTTIAPCARRGAATELLAGDDDVRSIDCGFAEREQHVVDHRPRELPCAASPRRTRASRCLAGAKRLTGRIAAVRMRPRSRATRRRRASARQRARARRRRPCACRSRASGGVLTVFVGDDPVEQLAVEVRDAGGAAVERRERHERGGRALQHLAADDRADGHDGRPGRDQRLADPRHGEDRARSRRAGWTVR